MTNQFQKRNQFHIRNQFLQRNRFLQKVPKMAKESELRFFWNLNPHSTSCGRSGERGMRQKRDAAGGCCRYNFGVIYCKNRTVKAAPAAKGMLQISATIHRRSLCLNTSAYPSFTAHHPAKHDAEPS